MTPFWLGLAGLVGTQIAYPLVGGAARAALVSATVALGFALSVSHAAGTRGLRTAAALVVIFCGGGLTIEAVGVATGFPFGGYAYGGALGPRVLGVPVVVPLAWAWMAWPSWIAAARLTRSGSRRLATAAVALAGWDLFLDPQMVAAGYWHWSGGGAHLPGESGVPLTNYVGWFGVALVLMACFSALPGPGPARADGPMLALYLWTYGSCVLAHAVFLGLPASAGWGALGMGVVAVPLAVRLLSPRWTPLPAPR